MGHCGGRAGEGFGAAEADREMGDGQCVQERERLFLAALQVEREGRAGAGAMTLVNVRLARALFEEAQITDLLDLRVLAQERAYLGGIAAGALASVSVPPRLTARWAILSASRKANASFSPPLR